MYLYKNNNNKIDVYLFKPIEDMIKDYRFDEMTKIPKEERVYRAITNDMDFPLDRGKIVNTECLNIEDLSYVKGRFTFHTIENYSYFKDYGYYSALDKYYKTGCLQAHLLKVNYEGEIKNFLLTDDHYCRDRDIYEMESIINLSEKLKILYYLETGNFDKITDSDNIEEQKSLFTLEPLVSVSKSNLKSIRDGILSNKKIQSDTKIIKRLQKSHK